MQNKKAGDKDFTEQSFSNTLLIYSYVLVSPVLYKNILHRKVVF